MGILHRSVPNERPMNIVHEHVRTEEKRQIQSAKERVFALREKCGLPMDHRTEDQSKTDDRH